MSKKDLWSRYVIIVSYVLLALVWCWLFFPIFPFFFKSVYFVFLLFFTTVIAFVQEIYLSRLFFYHQKYGKNKYHKQIDELGIKYDENIEMQLIKSDNKVKIYIGLTCSTFLLVLFILIYIWIYRLDYLFLFCSFTFYLASAFLLFIDLLNYRKKYKEWLKGMEEDLKKDKLNNY